MGIGIKRRSGGKRGRRTASMEKTKLMVEMNMLFKGAFVCRLLCHGHVHGEYQRGIEDVLVDGYAQRGNPRPFHYSAECGQASLARLLPSSAVALSTSVVQYTLGSRNPAAGKRKG